MAIATSLQHVGSLLEKLCKEWQAGNASLITPALSELLGLDEEQLQKGAQALAVHFGCNAQNASSDDRHMGSDAVDETGIASKGRTAVPPLKTEQPEREEVEEEKEEEEETFEDCKHEDVPPVETEVVEQEEEDDEEEEEEEEEHNEEEEELACEQEQETAQQDAVEPIEEQSGDEEEEQEKESAAKAETKHAQENSNGINKEALKKEPEKFETPQKKLAQGASESNKDVREDAKGKQTEISSHVKNSKGHSNGMENGKKEMVDTSRAVEKVVELKPEPVAVTAKVVQKAEPTQVPQAPSPIENQAADTQPSPEEAQNAVNEASTRVSGSRLRLLDTSQKNMHKLCKKKLKEIDDLGSQIDSKKLKYKDLSDNQKAKLARRTELQNTIAEIEALADELIEKEKEEAEAQRVAEEARLAEEALRREMETPEWKAANAARLARQAEEAARRAKEEAAHRADEELAAARRAREETKRRAEEEARLAAEEAARKAAIKEAKKLAEREAELRATEERERQQRLRKTSIKKLKEIQALEEKMKSNGQKVADLLPEVQSKLAKKAELEAQVASLDSILGPA